MTTLKKTSLAATIWLLAASTNVGLVLLFAADMPELLATHFDGVGHPNDWMTRSEFILWSSIGPVLIGLFVVACMYCARWYPKGLNVPHKAYWTAPENFPRAFDYILAFSFWFATVFVFTAALFAYGIYRVNAGGTVNFHNGMPVFATALIFQMIGMGVQISGLYSFFGKPNRLA